MFDGERFNLRRLNELEVRKQYHWDYKQVCSFGELKASFTLGIPESDLRMRFAYEIKKSIKIKSLGGFFPSLSPLLLPLSDSWTGLHPLTVNSTSCFLSI
jgi:hypothetical protein